MAKYIRKSTVGTKVSRYEKAQFEAYCRKKRTSMSAQLRKYIQALVVPEFAEQYMDYEGTPIPKAIPKASQNLT